jgi:hypothetical protein
MAFGRFHCKDCGSEVAFVSRRRNFWEKFFLRLLLLRPLRCAQCFRRGYRFFLTPALPREGSQDIERRVAA